MKRTTPRLRAGVTLIELLVSIAILAIASSVAVVSVARRTIDPRDDARARLIAAIASIRHAAIATGRSIDTSYADGRTLWPVRALPDGSIIIDRQSPLAREIDALSGRDTMRGAGHDHR